MVYIVWTEIHKENKLVLHIRIYSDFEYTVTAYIRGDCFVVMHISNLNDEHDLRTFADSFQKKKIS